MKKQLIGFLAAILICFSVVGVVLAANDTKAEDESIITTPDESQVASLNQDATTSSVFAYNVVSMNGSSLTMDYDTLKGIANNTALDGIKINASNGSIIMDRAYLSSILDKANSAITFSFSISGNVAVVSAKANGSTVYGDKGICIVEAIYAGGNIYSSVVDSKGVYVGTSCYYADGSVMRWQLTDSESYTFNNNVVNFNDITNHWSKDYILFLSSRGVVNGMTPGYYGPETTLTRGQFITILSRISHDKITDYSSESFDDVVAKDYFYNAVCWGTASGIVNGRTSQAFEPNSTISREEMATMCWRYTEYLGINLKPVRTAADFADMSSVQSFATTSVRQSYAAGYINGIGDNLFSPRGNATRAEAGTMIAGLISYLTAMPH